MRNITLLLFASLLMCLLNHQGLSQEQQLSVRYDDFIYDPQIKTVRLYRPEFDFSVPVLELNNDQQLLLSFDDLTANYRQFKYTIELCDAWWQPLNLPEADYIRGLFSDDIVDYRFSGNTRIPYVHYQLTFPNDNMKPILSGNYILKVWTEVEGSNVMVLTKRFFVVDHMVEISAVVTAGTLIETRWYKQEVDFSITATNVNIVNPYSNLKVVVMQNGRWGNGIFNLKPKHVKGNILEYNFDGENAFDGGNEFRNFNIKSMKYKTGEIDGIRLIDSDYHVFIIPDVKRNFLRYSQKSDINGRFFIKSDDYPESEVDGEYVYVYFSLMHDSPRTDGDLYVSGELSNRQLIDEFKMKYNFERKAYELTLLLKQGFYDYEYVFLPQGKVVGDYSEIDGRHFETENEYSIWVYYRQPGRLNDDLIGLKFLNSRN